MNHDDAMKAMVRKYAFESTSRFALSEEDRVAHIVAEAQYMVARKYGFADTAAMERALTPPTMVVNGVRHESTLGFAERRRG